MSANSVARPGSNEDSNALTKLTNKFLNCPRRCCGSGARNCVLYPFFPFPMKNAIRIEPLLFFPENMLHLVWIQNPCVPTEVPLTTLPLRSVEGGDLAGVISRPWKMREQLQVLISLGVSWARSSCSILQPPFNIPAERRKQSAVLQVSVQDLSIWNSAVYGQLQLHFGNIGRFAAHVKFERLKRGARKKWMPLNVLPEEEDR